MWTAGVYAALVLSAGVGLSLGLVGGGGSIVTVPILVYVAGLPAREAVALSLAVVGATAAVGAVAQWRGGNIHLKAALVFGLTGMLGAPFGARLTPLVPPPVLMLLFAALMIVVGLRMVRRDTEADAEPCPECQPLKCGLAGLGVGVLTGFLGVGGGFLIVPALLRFARTPMKLAVGTSMLIITASSLSGFVAHLEDFNGRMDLAAAFIGVALLGLAAGTVLARRMRPAGLKRVFGGVALSVAAYLVAMNVGPLVQLNSGR
ncbi:MAG: sulfite exporter TauE/SafE family protein [Actinomycetota bacterium]